MTDSLILIKGSSITSSINTYRNDSRVLESVFCINITRVAATKQLETQSAALHWMIKKNKSVLYSWDSWFDTKVFVPKETHCQPWEEKVIKLFFDCICWWTSASSQRWMSGSNSLQQDVTCTGVIITVLLLREKRKWSAGQKKFSSFSR